jgi:two-component system, cell cycle response regulator DivK
MPVILIVEDNPANLELLRDLLVAAGHTVEEAEDAQSCWTRLRARRPALILMDLQLPDIDGYTLTRQIKQDAAFRDIPIVAVTAYAMRGEQEKALGAGCAAVITKPIQVLEFNKAISRYLPTP